MPNLKEVRGRINSVKSTQQITKAMKLVAAAKLRKAQDKIIQMRPYAAKLAELLSKVSSAAGDSEAAVYGTKRDVKKLLVIPISSDKGLCGAFNSNIFRRINELHQTDWKEYAKRDAITYMPIGRKSIAAVKRKNWPVIDTYSELFQTLNFEQVSNAARFVMESFVNGTFDEVVIIYNEFKNVATQIVRNEPYLPILQPEETEDDSLIEYIYEPDKTQIVSALIPKSLKIQLFKAILESNASEHGARMTAMDKASDNAGELLKELNLMYNRSRQAAITNEILEIVSGAEALSKG